MRFLFLVLSLFFVTISCKLEPNTLTASPQKFDKEEYEAELKKGIENQEPLVQTNGPSSIPVSTVDTLEVVKQKKETFLEKSDTIPLKIVYGKAKIDTLKAPREKLIFVFNSDTAHKIKLKLTPSDSLANLRISQIIDSDGNSDGPFGQEIEYTVLKKGIHQVVVSESLMQGNPWGGKFSFEVQLGW